MKRRLLALLVTALVLSTMAVTSFAEDTSEWITTSNWVQDTSVDSTVPVKITVLLARENPSDIIVDSEEVFFKVRRGNTTTTDTTHGSIGELYQVCYINFSDTTTVFQSYTMYVGSIATGTGDYIEITLGDMYTQGSEGLKTGVRWRYTIEAITSSDDRFQEGYNAGYANGDAVGYARGYEEGDTAGYQRGYTEGYNAGAASGDAVGYARGYEEGDTAGYQRGYTEGYNAGAASGGTSGTYQEGYNAGYNVGYTNGDTAGYQRGYTEGYNQGQVDANPEGEYAQGFADGKAQGQDDASLIQNALDGFFGGMQGFFSPFLDIGVGALTIGGMLTLMVVSCIVIIIVKVVRG